MNQPTITIGKTIKHFVVLLIGLTLMSASVALAKIAALGTSPISSVPNVLSLITPFTIGQMTIVFNMLLIFLEWVLLQSQFSWSNIIQIIPTFFFGVMIDGFGTLFSFIQPDTYLVQLGLTVLSTFVLAFGVLLEVNSRALIMAGEGIAAALSLKFQRPFEIMKVRADLSMVLAAVILTLVFTHNLNGVREGTILAALLTGRVVGWLESHLTGFVTWLHH